MAIRRGVESEDCGSKDFMSPPGIYSSMSAQIVWAQLFA